MPQKTLRIAKASKPFAPQLLSALVALLVAALSLCCASPFSTASLGAVADTAPTYTPGARYVIDATAMPYDAFMFTTAVEAVVAGTVTVAPEVSLGTVNGNQRWQVDFTYSGADAVANLVQLRTQMNDPTSDGYSLFAAFYTYVSGTYYGIPTLAPTVAPVTTSTTTVATTTTATTTPPPTTMVPISWFTYTLQLASSGSQIDTTNFCSLIAAIVGQPASRAYVMGTPLYFNFVFANVTATFQHPNGQNAATSQPDLVAQLRKQMLSPTPSAAVTAFLAQYTVTAQEYIGYSPTIPKIIVTATGLPPNATFVAYSVAGAVSCDIHRVNITDVKLVPNSNSQLWNFTFTFVNDGKAYSDSRNSLDLALQLQSAFFYTSQPPFTAFLAPEKPFAIFRGFAAVDCDDDDDHCGPCAGRSLSDHRPILFGIGADGGTDDERARGRLWPPL